VDKFRFGSGRDAVENERVIQGWASGDGAAAAARDHDAAEDIKAAP